MDLVSFLKREHGEARSLLEKLADTAEGAVKTREKLFEQLRRVLEIHATLEETHLYPRLGAIAELRELAQRADAEHQRVRQMLDGMQRLSVDSEAFMQKLEELTSAVEEHIDEEEAGILPKAEQALGKEELDAIAEALEEEKQRQMEMAK
jgi:hemerythrin-like domain-containing protein